MMEDLKPCPFCGQKPKMKSGLNSEGKPFFQVTHDCMNLLSQIKTFCYGTEAEAATAWNRRAAPENKPLTLEQLRQMDGEPVWIKADHYGIYADIVNLIGKEDGENWVSFKINYRLRENGYGKTWLAYARKPEGSA